MAAELQNRLALDGLVCLYEDFTFCAEKIMWILPQNITITLKKQKDFKGAKSLLDKNIAEVRFGYFNNMPMSILVTSGSVNERIPFDEVRKFILKGVDHALSFLDASSPTKRDLQRHCCKGYEVVINKKFCSRCKTKTASRFVIFPQDINLFSDNFCNFLRLEFGNLNFGVFVVLYEFGQTLKMSAAVSNFENLNVENVIEIVVHVARDYKQQEKYLLWKREAVRELMRGGKTEDFFCCFTGKHGNFVFDFSNGDDVAIKHVKFYSDVLKEVHRDRALFRKPSVVACLMGNQQRGRENLNLDEIEKLVETITGCKDLALERKCNCARVEAIISLNNEENGSMKQVLMDSVNIFQDHLGNAKRLLSVFEFAEFENQVNNCLSPALKTLDEIIKSEKRFRTDNRFHCANLETLHLAMACEMTISYFIYGKLDYWKGHGTRFNKYMRNYLKLNGGTFRKAKTFQGLGFTKAITVENGRLRYTGTLLVNEFVSVGIQDEENKDRLSDSLAVLGRKENSVSMFKQEYQVVAEILWKEILLWAEKTCYIKKYDTVPLRDICRFILNKRHCAISSNGFVRWMFGNAYLEQKVVQKIIQAVKFVGASTNELQKELDTKIEMEIWKKGISFLYPAGDGCNNGHWSNMAGKTLIILPSLGASNQTFSTATEDIKKSIAYQYLYCFFEMERTRLTIPQIMKVLAMVEKYKKTDAQTDAIGEIFRQFKINYILDQCKRAALTATNSSSSERAAGPSRKSMC